MTSLSFLRQMLQDIRHQKVRTLLTLFGITWGTVSVSLLVAFGEGLEKRIRKNQRGLGENIVIAWPSRTVAAVRRASARAGGSASPRRTSRRCAARSRRPASRASIERDKSAFRRERVRPHPRHLGHQPDLRGDAQHHPGQRAAAT